MATTGYTDTFNRTVAAGSLGTATSGQTYTLAGTASQFSVTPSVATIAIVEGGDKMGYIDLQTQSVDLSGQVALTAIPATNQAYAGFTAKLTDASNYYLAAMMVATGGAISLRLFKRVAGTVTTLTTVATGLTYVANTYYNLRFQIFWSDTQQTNYLFLKLWAIGATQPGGWQAFTTDNSFNRFTSGTQVGLFGRDDSTTLGTVSAKFQSYASLSYSLPMPASTDTMCADPAYVYPKQTALQSLAVAADTAVATLDPIATLAGLFPRVRISATGATLNLTGFILNASFNTSEFNIGTSTNLGFDPTSLYLPVGIWLVTFELTLVEAASSQIQINVYGGSQAFGQPSIDMRSNAVQTNDNGVGGTAHISLLTYSTNPASPLVMGVTIISSTSVIYTASYMAFTAIKVSDYFL